MIKQLFEDAGSTAGVRMGGQGGGNVLLQDPGLLPVREELPEGRLGSSLRGSLERSIEVRYTAQELCAKQHGKDPRGSERWGCLSASHGDR